MFFSHTSGVVAKMAMLVGSPLWSRLKYPNSYEMDWHHVSQRMNPIDFGD